VPSTFDIYLHEADASAATSTTASGTTTAAADSSSETSITNSSSSSTGCAEPPARRATHLVRIRAVVEEEVPLEGEADVAGGSPELSLVTRPPRRLKLSLVKRSYLSELISGQQAGGRRPRVLTL
jgi:hypothetical protein